MKKTNEEIAREAARQIDTMYVTAWSKRKQVPNTEYVASTIHHCLTQAQEGRERGDPHFDSYTKAVLSLAMFDLAFHRLKSQALRLSVTRRNLSSEYQDAVLASELDKLIEIANEPEPAWPGDAARTIPSPGAEGDTKRLDWLEGQNLMALANDLSFGWRYLRIRAAIDDAMERVARTPEGRS